VPTELDDAWPHIDAELRRSVTDPTYAIWLEPVRPVALERDVLTVSAPDELRSWVTDRFGRVVAEAAAVVLGRPVRLDVVAPGAAPTRPASNAPAEPSPPARPTAAPFAASDLPRDRPFNPKLTFDQFVIGDTNRFAHAAALAVAEMPGQAYNPLFIYGSPGLGKTHLLHSIANYVTEYGTGMTVRYATAESFTNEFIASLHHNAIDAFKARFRNNDILLIDDVQFLESKAKTEEEFFHTFNALYDAGAQLVLTSDRTPRDLAALEDRLRARFESGLVTEVETPDHATRLTILRKRAHHDGVVADTEALELIADRITDNIRALEGAHIRVVAFSSLTRMPITAPLAAEVLNGLYPHERPVRRSVADVQAATAEAFGLSLDELVSPGRATRLTWPRQVAMYLARELTDQTLPAIGRAFGGRDHTTVLHACKRTTQRIAADPEAFEIVRGLTERLRTSR
jgi:chromosomal replication initiator protein